jgi:glutathionylspermidine synthase
MSRNRCCPARALICQFTVATRLRQLAAPYGEEGFAYQAIAPAAHYEGTYPILGSWMIDGVGAGIGIRESQTPVTSNLGSFVPHLFE